MGSSTGDLGVERERLPRRAVAAVALFCVAAALWLYWPALELGYHLDDYVHVATLEGTGVMPGETWYELFTFAVPVPDRLGPVQGDYLPWWHAEGLLLRFFRPLSGLTYAVDFALWGDDPVAFHASSLAWYAGLVAGSVALFAALARASGRGIGTVMAAGLVYALASEHEGSATWIAGRNTLVSVFFCPLALLAYHRWRTTGTRRALAWTLGLFGLGLLSNETPVALSGFFLAYELSLGRGRLAERVRGILPVAALAGLWLLHYAAAGWGTKHSGWYVNPITQPERFAEVGPGNFLALLTNALLPAALERGIAPLAAPGLVALFPHPEYFYFFAPLALLVVFAVHGVFDRTARFALLGTILCLIPLSAAPTPPRVLLLPTIGTSWLVASLAADTLSKLRRPRALLRPWNAVALAVVVGLAWWIARFEVPVARHRVATRAAWAAAIRERSLGMDLPTGEATAGKRVLLVTSASGQEALIAPLVRLKEGLGWPEGFWGISASEGPHELLRTGPRSFRLSLDREARPLGLIPENWAGLYRDDFELEVGQRFRIGVLEVTLADVSPGGRVHAVDVSLDRDLDDPDVWLMVFRNGGWERLAPPPVGERVALAG